MKRLPLLLLSVLLLTFAHEAQAQTAGNETRPDASRLGTIHFPTSGAEAAQPHFLRGVLLLHSFEYARAADAFREAQQIDPDFAMAYWGQAMTYNHPPWIQQDREPARAALDRLAPTSEARRAEAPTAREKAYLETVEILYGEGPKARRDTLYAEAMEQLAGRFPDDTEARAFYALSLLGLSQGERSHRSYMRAGAMALRIFREHPRHPGAMHYAIHAFDDPVHAPLGLPAARSYAQIAENAAHAQHMVSHIFLALGRWDEVVAANEKATKAVAQTTDFAAGSGRSRWPCGHNAKWLLYGYLQQGRPSAARELFGECRAVQEEHPDWRSPRSSVATMRAMLAVDTPKGPEGSNGRETLRLEVDTTGFGLSAKHEVNLADGLLAARQGSLAAATSALEAMTARREKKMAARAAGASPTTSLRRAQIMERVLRARILAAKGDREGAVEELRRAVAVQERLPIPFGPPQVVKPPSELLGEVLLALGKPAEAARAFRHALERTPRRPRSLLGLARAHAAAGEPERATETYRKLLAIWDQADPDLPGLAEARQHLDGAAPQQAAGSE